MVPYADFTYFLCLALYIILPTLVLRLAVRFSRYWIVLATFLMLGLQYGHFLEPSSRHALAELWILPGYLIYQWLIAVSFLSTPLRKRSRWPCVLAISLTALPLAVVKFQPDMGLGYVGISYVTFRNLDVIFGIHDGLIFSLPPAQFFAYTFFFPTISSGPIDRYRRFAADWQSHPGWRAAFLDIDQAIHRLFTGFLYKFIIAALIDRYWLKRIEGSGVCAGIAYMYGYSFYLFFDFAGYSAFAIGISYLLGIHTPENFARPFGAGNIREFWNRWHISLSTWLRDHVYMRFVMAATKGRWFKGRYTASYLGFFLAFCLMGVWHGVQWYYIAYGLYHGTLLSAYDAFTRWNRRHKLWGDGPWWRLAGVLVTFHLVCFGFLLFSGRLGPLIMGEGPPIAYQGALETSDCETIRGWARNPAQPSQPVEVEIREGETVLGKVVADQSRADLAPILDGDGRHGFSFAVPAALKDGRAHAIEARIAGTRIMLRGAPQTIACIEPLETTDGRWGALDTASYGRISGWAWDAARPSTPISVDVYEGETRLSTVLADRPRPDLLESGKGDGRHGFIYPVPDSLKDGKLHVIRVKIGGTDIDLKNSPALFRPPL
jgi:membrane protein involved in D-alanine export